MSFRDLALDSFYTPASDALHRFYVPVLQRAVRYDRVTGYYRSSSLAVAAAGISRFVANGGSMRIIAGAELSEEDVQALERGVPLDSILVRRLQLDPIEGAHIVVKQRLETLAWLAREGRLELRVGLPLGPEGHPLPGDLASAYFHAKFGILTDAAGDKVGFIGSDNESASGWLKNYEAFSVVRSWAAEWDWSGRPIVENFERLWAGEPDEGWQVVPLPDAVHEHLVQLAPPEPPPVVDPAEGRPPIVGRPPEPPALDPTLKELVDAPTAHGGTGVGYATAGISPWPHQEATARRIVETYPRSYLLADEVGLGKTIEVGLAIRELLVTGKAKRILLLVPASVLKQWQEELSEKFALSIPRLDRGGVFRDVRDDALPAPAGNPWRAFPVLLASSHLARRRSQRDDVLAAGPWDVVVVDEAHHAGRLGTKPDGTPNQLFRLLLDMRELGSFEALYLATATPMQMHPHEAWDLISLLGLPPLWAKGSDSFVRYFGDLRQPYQERSWEFLRRMSADHFSDPGVRPAEEVDRRVKQELGLAGSWFVTNFAQQGLSPAAAGELGEQGRLWLDEWLRANTPMRERVFRTSRDLLRHYQSEGILDASTVIPRRRVEDRFIPMRPDEQALYERIERYISRYYNAYMTGPKGQKALGFIMTVYRRRLTSSFLAIELSLKRRLDALLHRAQAIDLLTPDDLAILEGSGSFDADVLEGAALDFANEIAELQAFLGELAKRPPQESKMERLRDELIAAFHGKHDTAVVFTQYTDTMAYLRSQLVPTFGTRLICYSGNGGERWDPVEKHWAGVSKREVKELFRAGEEVKILLGTDAMSEGLNLQTSGKIINYDMPWNFMRVEQRIGRLDRIGGKPRVDVSNYFYEGTVEEQIYRGIGEDVDWFEDVVGPAQPVLNEIERAIEDVAMEEPSEARRLDTLDRINQIRSSIQEAKAQALTISDLKRDPGLEPPVRGPAIDLPRMEEILTTSPATRDRFRPDPDAAGAYLLDLPAGTVRVTFDRDVLEHNSPDVRLLTYLTTELDELLQTAQVGGPKMSPEELGPVGLEARHDGQVSV